MRKSRKILGTIKIKEKNKKESEREYEMVEANHPY
jgi:hypothetical protein